MKRAILVCDTFGWSFHNICKQIAKAFADRYEFTIIDRVNALGHTQADVVVYLWWKSAIAAVPWIKAERVCVGVYDHWSIPNQPGQFQKAADAADCIFTANEQLAADVRLRAPGKQIELTEDGVDLELFTPQPFPEEFTVGWTGNRIYEKLGLGDLKGVGMIEEACKLAGVPLVIQDKQVRQLTQEQMPEEFYRKISCYCCASRIEGTPNPVLESLACGRCVVSTAVGVVPQVVRGHCNGFLAKPTVESLADGITRAKGVGTRSEYCRASVADWDWRNKVQAFGPVLDGEQ